MCTSKGHCRCNNVSCELRKLVYASAMPNHLLECNGRRAGGHAAILSTRTD